MEGLALFIESFRQRLTSTLPLARNVSSIDPNCSETINMLQVLVFGVAPIIIFTLCIVGVVVLMTRLGDKCNALWTSSKIPPAGNYSKYNQIACTGRDGRGVHAYLLDIMLHKHSPGWIRNHKVRIKGDIANTEWHTIHNMPNSNIQRLIFTSPLPLAINKSSLMVEGCLPHLIQTGGQLYIPNHLASFYLPDIGIKWIRITDVKAGREIFTRCTKENTLWNMSKLDNKLTYYNINTDPSVVPMSYATWCFRNGWLWGVGGSNKSFLNRTRRMLLLVMTAACIAFCALIVSGAFDALEVFVREIPLVHLGTSGITTATVVNATLSTILSMLVVSALERALRYLPETCFQCCHQTKEENQDLLFDISKTSMFIINIDDDDKKSQTQTGCCRCFSKSCIFHTLVIWLFLFLTICTITLFGITAIILSGVCRVTFLQWLFTVFSGLLAHAFVLDPVKAILVAIVKNIRKDDMRLL